MPSPGSQEGDQVVGLKTGPLFAIEMLPGVRGQLQLARMMLSFSLRLAQEGGIADEGLRAQVVGQLEGVIGALSVQEVQVADVMRALGQCGGSPSDEDPQVPPSGGSQLPGGDGPNSSSI